MARSQFTVSELRAQAMLLGHVYDEVDHTFNSSDGSHRLYLDADTMEPLPTDDRFIWTVRERAEAVKNGYIGAADGTFYIHHT